MGGGDMIAVVVMVVVVAVMPVVAGREWWRFIIEDSFRRKGFPEKFHRYFFFLAQEGLGLTYLSY